MLDMDEKKQSEISNQDLLHWNFSALGNGAARWGI
jgi:hypothetical protein